MKIAIAGVNGKNNDDILDFFKNNYRFKIIDIDVMLDRFIKDRNILNTYFLCRDEFIKIKSIINNIFANEINKDDNVVVLSTILEEFDIFDDCDIKIKVSIREDILNDDYDIYINYKQSSIMAKYDDSSYHLILNADDDFQSKIDNYMNTLVYADTKVSIVIPVYNTEKYISRLVDSVTSQTYRNLEIIIIDDGSTDNSLKVCQLLATKDKRIKIFHQENMGLAETRNNGIKLATGEYISFLDSDDYIDKTMIEKLVEKAKKTNVDVCQCGFWIHMKDGFVKDVTNEQNGPEYFEGKENLINAYSNHLISIAAWDKLYKLSSIIDIQFNKNVTKEDSDYIYRLCMKEKTFAIVNKPFYH